MAVTFKGEPQDVPLAKIRANPFRDFAINPLKTSKVEALRADIDKIGFWSHSIQARPVGGSFEVAFGHHRLEALKQLGAKTVPLSVSDLSDAEMLQFMAQENDEEWGGDPEQTREAVRAVVLALADGRLPNFPDVPEKAVRDLRVAPSFKSMTRPQLPVHADGHITHVYTAETIARFVGWTIEASDRSDRPRAAKRVIEALNALELMEGREAHISGQLSGLRSTQSAQVIAVARKAGEVAARAVESRIPEAKKAGDHDRVAKLRETAEQKRRDAERTVVDKTVKQIKSGGNVKDVTARQVREVAERVSPTKKQAMPDLNDFIRRTIGILDGVLAPGAEVWQRRGKFESFFLDAKIPMQDSWINGLRRNAKRLQRLLEDEADRFEKLQKKGTV